MKYSPPPSQYLVAVSLAAIPTVGRCEYSVENSTSALQDQDWASQN